jgi:hypothetical protein
VLTEMRIATGESRPVTQSWPDGSFTCPWCGAANSPGATGCFNPACWASPYASAERVSAERAHRAELQRQLNEQRALAETAETSLKASRERDAKLWTERRTDAEQRGACLICLRRSDWRHQPRFVKHRRTDFHEEGS